MLTLLDEDNTAHSIGADVVLRMTKDVIIHKMARACGVRGCGGQSGQTRLVQAERDTDFNRLRGLSPTLPGSGAFEAKGAALKALKPIDTSSARPGRIPGCRRFRRVRDGRKRCRTPLSQFDYKLHNLHILFNKPTRHALPHAVRGSR